MKTPNIQNITQTYLIGIGGIGMSALARYFKAQGMQVAGYDRTPTPLTEGLKEEGINIHYEDSVEAIPSHYTNLVEKEQTLIIYTPAIPPQHKELSYFKDKGYNLLKRSQVLGVLSQKHKTIGVAGTHGKTTISSILAHLLYQSHLKTNALVGGILKNYGTNLLLSNTSPYLVVEADEYDRSFLQLHPHIATISAADPDHLDIYETKEKMQRAFTQYVKQIQKGGKLFIKKGLDLDLPTDIKYYTYSIEMQEADITAKNIQKHTESYTFDVITPWTNIKEVKLHQTSYYNIENTLVAIAVATYLGAKEEEVVAALQNFEGIHRRFEYKVKTDNVIYIDDYAHHPEELNASITSARKLYPDKKILGIFQPHLFTRTRDFAGDFAKSLEPLDEIILLDIYPAREEPIKGITSKIIFDQIKNPNKILCTKQEVLDKLKSKNIEMVMTLGAGDIDTLVYPITQFLSKNKK